MNYDCPIEGKETNQSIVIDVAKVCLDHQCDTRDRRGIFDSAGTDGNGSRGYHDFIVKRLSLGLEVHPRQSTVSCSEQLFILLLRPNHIRNESVVEGDQTHGNR
jgi:hypothetical protein